MQSCAHQMYIALEVSLVIYGASSRKQLLVTNLAGELKDSEVLSVTMVEACLRQAAGM